MASAQVLPNSVASSRKQGHLELGKKKLEEFRKKKAAKKTAPNGQSQASGIDHHDNFSKDNRQTTGEGASDGDNILATDASTSAYQNRSSYTGALNQSSLTSTAQTSNGHKSDATSVQDYVKVQPSKLYESLDVSNLANVYQVPWKETHELNSSTISQAGLAFQSDKFLDPGAKQIDRDKDTNILTFQTLPYGLSVVNGNSSQIHNYEPEDVGASHVSTSETSSNHFAWSHTGFQNSSTKAAEIIEVSQPTQASNINGFSPLNTHLGGKISDVINRRLNVDNSPGHASDFSSPAVSYRGSSDHLSSGYGTAFGRSRQSFLATLGVTGVSSMPNAPNVDSEKSDPLGSFGGSEFPSISSSLEQPILELKSMENSQRLIDPEYGASAKVSDSLISDPKLEHQAEFNHSQRNELLVEKKDGDFLALEQHIEDLTREKFSLQRALETAQSLTESLAAENSSLTDSFNQQGEIISQLKSDMERLQEEIKAHLLALDSIKLEYANAQLECDAADERAKLLASEVISLEDKALRLRSNELKLEKQLENLISEISSYKRKVSILEKERQDLQSTVAAMQEEKKLLQSKVRKASSSEKGKNVVENPDKTDASTSTDDLGVDVLRSVIINHLGYGSSSSHGEHINQDGGEIIGLRATASGGIDSGQHGSVSSSSFHVSLLSETGTVDLSDASGDLPHDQLRMIENIRSLISELSVEKEELVQVLRIESSNCSKLRELNKDLTQKLEGQMQRLELLTAQRMANENIMVKSTDTLNAQDATEYADEGDEVVERVLGWIMKLFPGGPAKRRTSKLM